MEALFLKLVNMSISASWLVLAVVVLRFAMKKAPKWMTCALWAMVALRLVLPFSIESAASLIPDREPIPQSVITNHTPIVTPADTPMSSDTQVITPDTPMLGTQANAVTPASITETAATVWSIGVAVLLVYGAVSYLLVWQRVSASLHLRDNVYLCDYIESPFILGILRPRIYLPSSLDQSQWPHVLAHEQAHLSRRDHWWKPLGFAILCVYWFNPVLWLAYILLCKDIELACDERVIRDMDTRQKQDYTTALLECSMPRYLVAACPLAFGEVGVKERVKTVLNYKKPAFWIILIALILCIAAAVCFLTDPVGNSAIIPGVYNIDTTLYQEELRYDGGSQYVIAPGQYILNDNALYRNNGDTVVAYGQMTPYDLTNRELNGYLQVDSWWKTFFHHIPTISEALWLRMDSGRFYVWFQTTTGETFLGTGEEDYSERYTESDDTHISQLCRLSRDDNAEEPALASFIATVVETADAWITVEPAEGTTEQNSADRIQVSLNTNSGDGIPEDIQAGDKVKIVYDGQIQETYPARIANVYSIEKIGSALYQYTDLVMAILDGCVTMVNGDVVAGQEQWKEFVQSSQNGTPASIRYVTYFTVGDSRRMAADLFREEWERYPTMYVHELTFDGNEYQVRWLEGDTEYVQTWKYLMRYETKAANEEATFQDCERYVLTDRNDVSWEDLMNGMYSADFKEQIPFKEVYTDYIYRDQPIFMELEAAKTALEPYMLEYNITSLDANELTMRLDIGVSQWVTGLEDVIEQFVDLHFVTIFHQDEASFTDNTEPTEPILPDGFNVADILGTWEAYYYDDDLNDGKINDAYYVVDTHNIAKIRLYNDGTGLVYMKDATLKDITWEIVESEDPNTIHVTTPVIDIWYHTDPQSDAYQCMTYPVSPSGFNGTMKRISDDGEPVVFQGDAQITLTDPTSTEALVTCSLQIPENCEVWTGYDFELEVYADGQWVHYGYPPEEQAWPTALLIDYENESDKTVTLDFTLQERWTSVTDAPLPPGTYRYRRSFSFYYNGLYFSVPCYVEFTVSEDTPADPGIHMEILNPTDTGATLAVTYNGGLMGELTTQGQYYLNVIENGGATTYGLLPRQVDWDDVLYTLNVGETVYIDVHWDHTAEAPLPVGTYSIVLLCQQHITIDGQTYQTDKRVVERFAIID